ncbi:MAG: FG-GAP repeat protein [Chloroflexi bacterium]|nr:FG-GAP repeat protein [Chloroflexota bacterium]
MRKLLPVVFLLSLLGPRPAIPWPASAATCEFVLGFKTLYDAIPAIAGECLENQRYDPVSGDALQQTTSGLFYWRKADNHTAFTDGYRTWLSGPYGVEQRFNTERLLWEVVEQARNAEYRLPLVDPRDRREKETAVRLVNGEYTSSSESPPERIRVGLLAGQVAVGDLDGDGVADAAVPLWLNTGGSGTFIYLIALLDRNPLLVQAGRALLGDRVKVNAIGIADDGTTTVDMIAHGQGDPMCCPTRLVVRTFQAADLLTIVGPAEIDTSRISLDTQGLSAAWQADVVRARPYDRSQPPGPRGLPKHLRIILGNSEAYRVGEPVMYIVPLAAYQQLWEDQGDRGVTNMLGKIGPLVSLLPSPPPASGLPALPYEQIGGVNDLSVQLGRASVTEKSASRNGFRYVGRFAQDANPVSRENLRYIYLGFTNDGQYLVAFFYPVTTAALPAIQEVPAEEFDRVVRDHRAYMQEKADMLNKLPSSAWQPDLAKLDALVGSLEIKGPSTSLP